MKMPEHVIDEILDKAYKAHEDPRYDMLLETRLFIYANEIPQTDGRLCESMLHLTKQPRTRAGIGRDNTL